jgi:hypothetical protein
VSDPVVCVSCGISRYLITVVSGPRGSYLFKQLAKAHADHALAAGLVWRTWVDRHIQAWNAESSARPGSFDHILQDNVGLLLVSAGGYRLVADGINRPVQHVAVMLDDLVNCITLAEVDWDAADLLGGLQSLRHSIHNVHLAGSPESRRVRRHQSHGSSTPDPDGLSRLEPTQRNSVPARRKDVCQEDKVGFMLFAGWQLESVEVGIRNADVLSLATCDVKIARYFGLFSSTESGRGGIFVPLYGPMAT